MADEELSTRIAALSERVNLHEQLTGLERRIEEGAGHALDRPWWRSPKAVTTLGAIIAAVIPLNTAIQGWWTSYRDLQTRQLNQSHEVRRAYIDRVLDPGLGAEDRKLIFEILAEFDDEPALQSWAFKNLAKETERLQRLEDERDKLQQEAEAARSQLVEARSALAEVSDSAEKKDEEILQLKSQIDSSSRLVDLAVAEEQKVSAKIVGRNMSPVNAPAPITYRLTLHVGRDNQLESAKTLSQRLEQAAGSRVVQPGAVEKAAPVSATQLRYFHDADQSRAYALVGCLNRLGLTSMNVVAMPNADAALRQGSFELWLGPELKNLDSWDGLGCVLP